MCPNTAVVVKFAAAPPFQYTTLAWRNCLWPFPGPHCAEMSKWRHQCSLSTSERCCRSHPGAGVRRRRHSRALLLDASRRIQAPSRPRISSGRFVLAGLCHQIPSLTSLACSDALHGQAETGRQVVASRVGSIGIAIQAPPWSPPMIMRLALRCRLFLTMRCWLSSTCTT